MPWPRWTAAKPPAPPPLPPRPAPPPIDPGEQAPPRPRRRPAKSRARARLPDPAALAAALRRADAAAENAAAVRILLTVPAVPAPVQEADKADAAASRWRRAWRRAERRALSDALRRWLVMAASQHVVLAANAALTRAEAHVSEANRQLRRHAAARRLDQWSSRRTLQRQRRCSLDAAFALLVRHSEAWQAVSENRSLLRAAAASIVHGRWLPMIGGALRRAFSAWLRAARALAEAETASRAGEVERRRAKAAARIAGRVLSGVYDRARRRLALQAWKRHRRPTAALRVAPAMMGDVAVPASDTIARYANSMARRADDASRAADSRRTFVLEGAPRHDGEARRLRWEAWRGRHAVAADTRREDNAASARRMAAIIVGATEDSVRAIEASKRAAAEAKEAERRSVAGNLLRSWAGGAAAPAAPAAAWAPRTPTVGREALAGRLRELMAQAAAP